MNRLERRGYNNLTGKGYEPPKTARTIVRIYYRSQGGEILCCDSAPLTSARADELRASLRGSDFLSVPAKLPNALNRARDSVSDAVHAECLPVSLAGRTAALYGARLVVLPSQSTEPVVMSVDGDEVAAWAPKA